MKLTFVRELALVKGGHGAAHVRSYLRREKHASDVSIHLYSRWLVHSLPLLYLATAADGGGSCSAGRHLCAPEGGAALGGEGAHIHLRVC